MAKEPGPITLALHFFSRGLRGVEARDRLDKLISFGSRSPLFDGHPIPQEVDNEDSQGDEEKDYNDRFGTGIRQAADIQKGEEMEWLVEDRNTFILKRIRERKSFLNKRKSKTKASLA